MATSIAALGWWASISATNPAGNDPQKLNLLTPAERMEALAKFLKKEDLQPVARGTVSATIIERGSVEAVNPHMVQCVLRAAKPNSTVASTIRWIIDEGTKVKKGDKVVQLDDTALQERIKDQRIRTAEAQAALLKAKTTISQVEEELRIDLRLAEIGVKLAALELEKHGGKGALDKQILELKVEKAQLFLDRVKHKSTGKLESAKATLAVNKLMHQKELGRERELESDIKNCLMIAPADGIVIYHVHSQGSSFGGRQKLVAEGEGVAEGQTLMIVTDLSKLQLRIRLLDLNPEQVRKGQKAHIHVDALPNDVFSGQVSYVADQPNGDSFPVAKLYTVIIQINGDLTHLLPHMSGKATISVGERANVLRVPVKAVLDDKDKKEKYCYVKVGNEIHIRPVQLGLKGNEFIEIEQGLTEGDHVLVDPKAVMKRLPGP